MAHMSLERVTWRKTSYRWKMCSELDIMAVDHYDSNRAQGIFLVS
jgi:hypothetical protein